MIKKFRNLISEKEAACKCGCGYLPKIEFIEKVYAMRIIAGIPFRFSSFARCKNYNKVIGGAPDSAHLQGLACDIKYKNSFQLRKIVESAIKVVFEFIEICDHHVHIDDKERTPEGKRMIWGKSK